MHQRYLNCRAENRWSIDLIPYCFVARRHNEVLAKRIFARHRGGCNYMNKKQYFRLALTTIALGWSPAFAIQEPPRQSILILTSAGGDDDETILGDFENEHASPPSKSLLNDSSKAKRIVPIESQANDSVEIIRDRFSNGRVRIERQVALDQEGNFVNHGDYQEWNEAGDLVVTGKYEMGKKQGSWVRICQAKESKLFQSYPYDKSKGPFHSTAEFVNGEMDGFWTITDSDNRVISQVQLAGGLREGQSTFYHPSGSIQFQFDCKDGILNGRFLEQDTKGKTLRDEQFVLGKKLTNQREFYPNKAIKADYQVLSATQDLKSRDNFDSSTLATFDSKLDSVRTGSFVLYHQNGEVRARGVYEHDQLVGEFICWYDNGQKEVVGNYDNGKQDGKWTWWHSNGMRKATGNYTEGKLSGDVLAWNEQGRRISPANPIAPVLEFEERSLPVNTGTEEETTP